MKRVVHLFSTSRLTDPAFLILICVVVASGWLNSDLPKGHDAIGVIQNAAQIRNFFLSYSPLDCHGHETLGSFQIGTPQFYYLPTILSFLFSWSVAAKLFFFLIYALSAVFAYLCAYELTKSRPASFIAGLAYVFAPFYLIEVVFEGHWDIGAQYMLTPLVFLATEKAIQQPKIGRVILAGLSLALLIALGHPQTLPILVGPFLALYMLFRIWMAGKQRIGINVATCLFIFLIGLALTAFWWLPLLREISYFQAPYTLEASESFKATFLQALTLRPSLDCAPSSAYGASPFGMTTVLCFLPFILAVLGIVLNRKNKYVWFFSASILITWLLAMGSASPIPVFSLVQRYVPLFSGLRTPVRLLLFTSFAYAILIGFCVKGISECLGHVRFRKFRYCNVILAVLVLASFIVMANTWREARSAFSTFTLSPDRSGALNFLTEQGNGDYRIADSSFEIYAYDPETRSIVNPIYWAFIHGKEALPGGMPASNRYTTNLIESLLTDLDRGPLDMSEWLSLLNLKYIIVDKTDPLSSNVILGPAFERVWTSDTIDIYENHSMKPRIFSFSNTNERVINLSSKSTINLTYAEGTQEPVLSLSDEHRLSDEPTVKSSYHFTIPYDYLCLEANVEGISFSQNDAIHFVFYSPYDMPDVHLSLDLLERDGSRYDVVLDAVDGIKAGWNEFNFPISLLSLRYSTDENDHLDLDQIDRLWIGVGKQDDSNQTREFSLYFDKLSVVTQEMDTNIEYTKIRPGKYEVHVNLDSPSYLVLSEAYHPNWVARVNGSTIHSQIIYQALNGFYLEPGEYDITLEFSISPLRTAGNVITVVTVLLLGSFTVFLLIRRIRSRRHRQPHADVSNILRN